MPSSLQPQSITETLLVDEAPLESLAKSIIGEEGTLSPGLFHRRMPSIKVMDIVKVIPSCSGPSC